MVSKVNWDLFFVKEWPKKWYRMDDLIWGKNDETRFVSV